MSQYKLPEVGAPVLVTLPRPYGRADAISRYTVADVRERQLTLRSEQPSVDPAPPPGVPCLVGAMMPGGRRSSCEAVVVASGVSMLIVDVARDPRQHPRYRRPCKVTLEVPDMGLGVVEGVLEDLSAGGMRVHCPALLPLDHRVFVSILLSDTQPILAIGEVRGVDRGDGAGDLVARVQFTMMSPSHRTRLATLLEWPVEDEDGGPVAPSVLSYR